MKRMPYKKYLWIMVSFAFLILFYGCQPSEEAGSKIIKTAENVSKKTDKNTHKSSKYTPKKANYAPIIQSGSVFEYKDDIFYTVGSDDSTSGYKLLRQKADRKKKLLEKGIYSTFYLFDNKILCYKSEPWNIGIEIYIIDLNNDSKTMISSDEMLKKACNFYEKAPDELDYNDFRLHRLITIKDDWAFILIKKVRQYMPEDTRFLGSLPRKFYYDIVKVKLDGTKTELVKTIKSYIAGCYNGGVYYGKDGFLHRVDIDGTEEKLDCKFKERDFITVRNHIYYIGEDKINYKINLDTLKTEINPVNLIDRDNSFFYNDSSIIDDGEYLYYNSGKYNESGLIKAKKNGSEKIILSNGRIDKISIISNWVYFTKIDPHGKYISKMSKDGKKYKILYDYPRGAGIKIDGWIYYSNHYMYEMSVGAPTYKIKPDGTGFQRISEYGGDPLIYKDGWLYFDSFKKFGKMKPDGSNVTIWEESPEKFNEIYGVEDDSIYNIYKDYDFYHSIKAMMDGSEKEERDKFVFDYDRYNKLAKNFTDVPIPVEEYENK